MLKNFASAIHILLLIVICNTAHSMHTTKSSGEQINSPYISAKKCPFGASIIKSKQIIMNVPQKNTLKAAYQYGLELETVHNNLVIMHEELQTCRRLKYLNVTKDILSEEKWHCTKKEEIFYKKIIDKLAMLADLYMAGGPSLPSFPRKYILLTHAQKEYDIILKRCLELEKDKNIAPYDIRLLIKMFNAITLQTDCSDKITQKYYKHKTKSIITTLSQLNKLMVDSTSEENSEVVQKEFTQILNNLTLAYEALAYTSSNTTINVYKLTSEFLERVEEACCSIEKLIEKNEDKNGSKYQSQRIMYQEFYNQLTQLLSDICKEYRITDPFADLRQQVYASQCLINATLTRLFTPAAKVLLEDAKNEFINTSAKNKVLALKLAEKAAIIHDYLILPPFQNKNLDLWRWKGECLLTLQAAENDMNKLVLEKLWQTRSPIIPCISLTSGWRTSSFGETCENAIAYFSFFDPQKIERETSCECIFAQLWLDAFYIALLKNSNGSINHQIFILKNHQWVNTPKATKRFKLLKEMLDERIDKSDDSEPACQKLFLNTIDEEIKWAETVYNTQDIVFKTALMNYLDALSGRLGSYSTNDDVSFLDLQYQCCDKITKLATKIDLDK
jgi:hypothetical protein